MYPFSATILLPTGEPKQIEAIPSFALTFLVLGVGRLDHDTVIDNLRRLSLLSAALSNLISNLPAVMVLKPVLQRLPDAATCRLALAGNLSLLGSVANRIVVEQARKHTAIGFWEYTAHNPQPRFRRRVARSVIDSPNARSRRPLPPFLRRPRSKPAHARK